MPSTRIEERREATKSAILDAAWKLARRDGLNGIGMRELAAELGMAAPSLYGYFPSKDAIFDAMFVQGNQQLVAHAEASTPPRGEGLRASLEAAAHSYVEFCNEDPVRFQLLFQLSIPGWRPSEDAYAAAVQTLDSMRARLVDFGLDSQEDLDLWTALTTGLASQQVANDPGGDRWIRLIEPTVAMYLSSRGLS